MFDHVWRAGAIGLLALPHRIVMGSMHLGLEGIDDGGAALAAFYRERASGGAGLIVTGGSAVSRVGAGGRNYSFVNEDADAEKLSGVAAAVHGAGGLVLLQLFHAGRYAYEASFGLTPVAPSPVYSRYSRCEPRELSGAEVLATIEDFARGARRARELGFDGVEIMGSEGYLIDQFLAPVTNLRDDEWGGDPERRMRFPLAVATAVREAAGPGQAIVFRMSGASFVEGGGTQGDVRELARSLAAEGAIDAINVGMGWHESRVPTVQALVPHGAWRPWARAIREAVDVPVIASNRINTVALAEDVLASGDADFVSMARPFLADPEIVAKARDRRKLNICIACNQACIDRSIFDKRVSCLVNPRAGYELELAAHAAQTCAVAVVGGGPAGMEAARALASAGHSVELFEASDRLGGQFRMACRIPGKEDFARTIEYFECELERLGVTVRLETPVRDPAALNGFDAAVIATGVVPRPVGLPGADLPHVVSYAELLRAGGVWGESVAIIGAGGIGVDVAHLVSHHNVDFYAAYGLEPPGSSPREPARSRGGRVTLMRRGSRVGERIGPSTRWAVVQELRMAGVEILTGVAYERIEPGSVIIHGADGAERRVEADTVVIAAGQEPETALASSLASAAPPHVVIGGAAGAAELDAERAFREGARAPLAVAELLG
ncbi:MAG TPA: FAD-dependent oxidoreductase [Solirubrobacteraceae bacterium]|nr:FAD-dependent oxidoreductase [Solirubrobacteraceae bacterium]